MSEDKLPRADNLYDLASVRCPNCGAGDGGFSPRFMDQKAEHAVICRCETCGIAARAECWIAWPE
jgi:uncharacterized Zn finger protein